MFFFLWFWFCQY